MATLIGMWTPFQGGEKAEGRAGIEKVFSVQGSGNAAEQIDERVMKINRVMDASIVAMIFLVCLCGKVSGESETRSPVDKIRGITLLTHRGGRELGDRVILDPSVRAIASTGANWIAYHPYARIERDGTVSARFRDGEGVLAHWTEPIQAAHAQGLKVCVKPHLAHWRSGFSWRGEITFDSEEAWERFWTGYTKWIVALAEACHDADLFVVATELDRTMSHHAEWRDLIRRVREQTDASLTFASNWDAFEKVPFWDALDLIGVQAYFPISTAKSPSRRALVEGWTQLADRLATYSRQLDRQIVLTELGYNQSFSAASEPWAYPVDPAGEPLQLACMSVALRTIKAEPAIVGALLWKWFPEPRPIGRNFQLATPGMREVISSVWGEAANEADDTIEATSGD
jgi:hypothetical protein